jgi:branched-chain amino acid aminotransferase
LQLYAFFAGEFVPLEEAKISVMTHGFLYGTGCFEGIRAYWSRGEEELFIFRMEEHYQRLERSCRILRMSPGYSLGELMDLTGELLRRCGFKEDCYIRPMVYKKEELIEVRLTGIADGFVLFAVPFGEYLDLSKGLRAKVSSWVHLGDNSIPMRAKVAGAYVNAALAKSEALDDGYDEAIFLGADGHVSEGSAENLFLVRDGQLITPPVTADILEGVTRDTVIELARGELGLEVWERAIDRTELYVADEAFFVGTGAQVSPIVEIDGRPLGDGSIGPISRQVQELYFRVVKGQVPKYRHWCTPVYR